jgi:hypothetical protein
MEGVLLECAKMRLIKSPQVTISWNHATNGLGQVRLPLFVVRVGPLERSRRQLRGPAAALHDATAEILLVLHR